MTITYTTPASKPWGNPGAVLETAYPTGLVAAVRLGRANSAWTDAQALNQGGCNLVKPSLLRGTAARRLRGAPVVQTDYWTFLAGTDSLGYAIPEPAQWCAYVSVRTQDSAPSGAAGCPIFGWYGGNDGLGSGLILYSTAAFRLLCYQAPNPTAVSLKSAQVGFTNGTQSTWRALYAEMQTGQFGLQSLTGSGSLVSTTVSPSTQAGVRQLRLGSLFNTYTGAHTDINQFRLYSGVSHDASTKAGIYAEMQAAAGALTF